MSDAISSFGTLLKLRSGLGSGTYSTVAFVGDIKSPSVKLKTEQVLHHSMTSRAEQKEATIIELGECTFDVYFDPAQGTHDAATGLLYLRNNAIERDFQIIMPDTGNYTETFSGFVTECTPEEPVDGLLKASVTIDVTSLPAYTT